MITCDICIIGAGPAGLTAAIAAARAGAKVAVLERNTSAGRKLLKTGRTRCNLTHAGDIDHFLHAYGQFARFLRPALYDFPPDALRAFFHDRRLPTVEEPTGCVFPASNRASDVLRVLLDEANRLAVKVHYGRRVESIEKSDNTFRIATDKLTLHAPAVIIATGGRSWAFTGSSGDGYRLAQSLGHSLVPPRPALCPLITVETFPADLQGAALPDARISARLDKKKLSLQGPMLFTAQGIGGPAVFDFSRLIADYFTPDAAPLPIALDLCPDLDRPALEQWLIAQSAAHPRKDLAHLLAARLPRRLAQFLERLAADAPTPAGRLTRTQRQRLLDLLKALPLTVRALAPLDQATVTRGGIPRNEIDPRSLQSRLCPGLFFAGEIIDADGPCGGYNLQIAWSTAHLAAQAAARLTTPARLPLDLPPPFLPY